MTRKLAAPLLLALACLVLGAGSAGAATWSGPSAVPNGYAGSYALGGDGTLFASSYTATAEENGNESIQVRAPGAMAFVQQDLGIPSVFGQDHVRSVRADEDGNAIAWIHDSFYGQAWASYRPAGSVWTPVSADAVGARWFHAAVRNGYAVRAWGDPAGGVKVSRRTAGGGWSDPLQLATATAEGTTDLNPTESGKVAVSAGGDITVVWRDSTTGFTRQKSRVNGAWGSDQNVSGHEFAYPASIEMSNNGTTTIAWNRLVGHGAAGDYPAAGPSAVDEEDLHSFAADPEPGHSTVVRGAIEVATRPATSTSFGTAERHFDRVVNFGSELPLAVAPDGTTAILAWRDERLYLLRRAGSSGQFTTRMVEPATYFDSAADTSSASLTWTDSGLVAAYGANVEGELVSSTRRFTFAGAPAAPPLRRGVFESLPEITITSNGLGDAVLFWERGPHQHAFVYDGSPVNVHDVKDPDQIVPGSPATFSAKVSNGLPTITWQWGDGTPATTSQSGQNRTHTFAQPGKYRVVATASDEDGGTDSEEFDVYADGVAPELHVASPKSGEHFAQGQHVTADFLCTDDVEVASCSASTPDGQALPTGSPGAHTFTITAIDGAGHKTTANIGYFVDAKPSPPSSSAGPKKRSYSVQSVQDTFTPVVPYIDEFGRVVEAYENRDGTVGYAAISACEEGNLASYDKKECDRRRDEVLAKQGNAAAAWQGSSAGNLLGTQQAPAPPSGKPGLADPRFAIYDKSGKVIASGGGNLIGEAGTNLIGEAGTNLTVKAGDIWVPPGNGVQVLSRNAGQVTDATGKLIGEAGTNFVPTSGGNIVFKGTGFQLVKNGKVIASGGGNVIASGGGNVIASGGGNVIASGGGNLIGQAGTNLIGEAGSNLIGQAGTNIALVANRNALAMGAGTIAPTSGGAFASSAAKRRRPARRDLLPRKVFSFMEMGIANSIYETKVLAPGVKRGKRKAKPVVVAASRLKVGKPGLYPLSLKLTKQGTKLLKQLRKRGKRVKLTLVTTTKPARGKAVTVKRKLSVKPRKAKQKRSKKRRR